MCLFFKQGFVMWREYILDANDTGLLFPNNNTFGSYTSLPGDILQGQSTILYGSGSETSTYLAPSESIASWEAFFTNVVVAEAAGATNGP